MLPIIRILKRFIITYTSMSHSQLQMQDIDSISERLKDVPLKLPRSLGDQPDADAKEMYLRNLLSRDAGIFLERHGGELNDGEKAKFEPLRPQSFEVDYYLGQLEDSISSSKFSSSAERAVVRNRRLAKLNRLNADGFFLEVRHDFKTLCYAQPLTHTSESNSGPCTSS